MIVKFSSFTSEREAENQQQEDTGGQGRERAGRGRHGAGGEALTVLYLNAQSISGKIDELACVARDTDTDLILITESWCNDEISNAFYLLTDMNYRQTSEWTEGTQTEGEVEACWCIQDKERRL